MAASSPSLGGQQLDTKEVLREALNANGELERIKAQLRAAVFHALDASSPDTKATPPPTPENTIINEMVREYLVFNGFEHTLAVFKAEARLPKTAIPRNIIATEVGLPAAPASVPLLYAVVEEGKLCNATETAAISSSAPEQQ